MPSPGPFAHPEDRTQLREAKTAIAGFSRIAGWTRAFCNISRPEEHLFRSVICQAVILTRWEQNK
jgi:hypothetical protein